MGAHMRVHLINGNGVVYNTILASDLSAAAALHPDAAEVAEAIAGGIGWGYDGGDFIPPPHPPAAVPDVVSRFQAKAAMLLSPATDQQYANLYEQIEALIMGGDDVMAKLAWIETGEWHRHSPMVLGFAAQVWTDEHVRNEQLDALFIAAAQIEA